VIEALGIVRLTSSALDQREALTPLGRFALGKPGFDPFALRSRLLDRAVCTLENLG
jgi:hypothetical protein